MLDKQDLQAIREMMTEEIGKAVSASEERMKGHMDLLMENEVRPNFRILAEGHETILQQVNPRLDDLEQRVDHLETEVMLLKSAI
ncbi:MAG: hypothetical protein IK141_08040 [Clostridia bacterium]|nr:hypothetical protein [Clostridia bacterium]